MLTVTTILEAVSRNWGGTIEDGAEQIVAEMIEMKTFRFATWERDYSERCSIGFFDAIAKEIKEWRKANYAPARSAQQIRIDQIRYITDSTGKRTARK